MRFTQLNDWLEWQQSLNPKEIDLGLERVAQVAARLGLLKPKVPVITVAGTNGKGSSMAYLHAIYTQAGYKAGSYTSPHIFRYNERIRLGDSLATDAQIVDAFYAIDQAREDLPLTYFEFGTLAAMWLFDQQQVDVWLLEVGLGGRLDAVNIIDADVALLTNVSLDHQEFLGDSLGVIAKEKAGVCRSGKPAIVASQQTELAEAAEANGALVYQLGPDYLISPVDDGFVISTPHWESVFPLPALGGAFQQQNAAGAVMAVKALQASLPVCQKALDAGLQTPAIQGRLDNRLYQHDWYFDVGHNYAAAEQIADYLASNAIEGETLCVFSMLNRKNAQPVIEALGSSVDHWYVAELPVDDAKPLSELAASFQKLENVTLEPAGFDALLEQVKQHKKAQDRVLVFGSFVTVEESVNRLN